MTNSDQHAITITHQHINATRWFVKLLSRSHFKLYVWREPGKDNPLGDPIRAATSTVKQAIEAKTGLPVEKVAKEGRTGTSTTGNVGRRFFSKETTSIIGELASERDRENLLLLHCQISAVLRIISSVHHRVDTEALRVLCLATVENIAKNFSWAPLCETLHGSLQHSVELIERNDSYSLGALSEEALEANNKDIRNMLAHHGRHTSSLEQLTDVMNRQIERSHPLILHAITKIRPTLTCSECEVSGHTVRSHHSPDNVHSTQEDKYDELVNNVLL